MAKIRLAPESKREQTMKHEEKEPKVFNTLWQTQLKEWEKKNMDSKKSN